MRLTNLVKKNSFIFKLLVCTLIVFCFPIKTVKAGNLTSLEVVGYENDLDPAFNPGTYNYSIDISENEIDLYFNYEKEVSSDEVTISNNKYIKNNSGTIVIDVSGTKYNISYTKVNVVSETKNYSYTGTYRLFKTKYDALYKFELWGAQGGSVNDTYHGGYGGYTSGSIKLNSNKKLYIYVGSQDSYTATGGNGGYNGGGSIYTPNDGEGRVGGGATDIRTYISSDAAWDNDLSLKSRIMVAGGGGGASYQNGNWYSDGGAGGGLTGFTVTIRGPDVDSTLSSGSQTAGGTMLSYNSDRNYSGAPGSFGKGGLGTTNDGASGGGGGYYGGCGNAIEGGGSGGSSYISGHTGCVAITSESDLTPRKNSNYKVCTEGTTDNLCSIHYSGYTFDNTVMIDGQGHNWTNVVSSQVTGMPTTDGLSTENGHRGNGYAKVTVVSLFSNDNYLESMTSDVGSLSPAFDPTENNYSLHLNTYERSFNISGILSDDKSMVTGFDTYTIEPGETKNISVAVLSESGNTRIYNIVVTRDDFPESEHSSKLKNLFIDDYSSELNPSFTSLETNYSLLIYYKEAELKITAEPFDSEATVEISGNKNILTSAGTVTITVKEPHVADTIYTINYTKTGQNFSQDYQYTGRYQEFFSPLTAFYKVELWGAQGGSVNETYHGGYGGYTSGLIKLDKGTKLYIYVGSQNQTEKEGRNGGYNGGGNIYEANDGQGRVGGGATDIRLEVAETGFSTDFDSLKTRIMVAGGGGGASYQNSNWYSDGGAAGGLTAYSPMIRGPRVDNVIGGASQTAGGTMITSSSGRDYTNAPGKFGIGGMGTTFDGASGGGGGYYGGCGNAVEGGGSGGSSYISGHDGCDAIASESTINNIVHTNQSIHYSNYKFIDTKMIDGAGYEWTDVVGDDVVGMPTTDGLSTENGHRGDGYAKITQVAFNRNNFLETLTPSYGTLSPAFDPTIENYELLLDKYDQHFSLDGTTYENTTSIVGLGVAYDVELGGQRTVQVVLTSENGEIRTYTITAKRGNFVDGEHSSKLKKMYIRKFDNKLSPEFHSTVYSYNIDILATDMDLFIDTETYDEEATVEITGNGYLVNNTGTITINVTEPHVNPTTYTITYTKDFVLNTSNFMCTNSTQLYNVPISGKYKLEVWGSQGAGSNIVTATDIGAGGSGGYSVGTINLSYTDKLFVEVGCYGTTSGSGIAYGGYNGGGAAFSAQDADQASGGGGATDIRINDDSLYSRVIVAGGGGGGSEDSSESAGVGGGLTGGGNSRGNNYAGTQTSASGGAEFGQGASTSYDGGGGGGGWYGGGTIGGSQKLPKTNTDSDTNGGSGGSGFVLTEDSIVNVPEGYLLDSTYYLSEASTIDGNNPIPSPTSDETQVGNRGEGYAKITYIPELNSDNYLSSLSVDKGTLSPAFDPTILNYTVNVDMYIQKIKINAIKSSPISLVVGGGEQQVNVGDNNYQISVVAEDGSIRIYRIKVIRAKIADGTHTAELEKLLIDEYDDVLFERDVYEYDITILPSEAHLNLTPIPYDLTTTYEIEGNDVLDDDEGTIRIITHQEQAGSLTYTINYIKELQNYGQEYTCTGDVQTFVTPKTGTYLLEVWGAQGGGKEIISGLDLSSGGKGGYSKGKLNLTKGQTLYVYVGCVGSATGSGYAPGGYNGGGGAFATSTEEPAAGGGGATDIRFLYDNLYSRFIVAGGGGGGGEDDASTNRDFPGHGGGLVGGGSINIHPDADDRYGDFGGTQTSASGGAVFGYGANTAKDGGGGGGGWYGGGARGGTQKIPTANDDDDTSGGSGGSGFVLTSETASVVPEGYILLTEYYLKQAETIGGDQEIPTHDGTSTMIGNTGAGYAKINMTDIFSKNNYLNNLIVSNPKTSTYYSLTPGFNSMIETYTLNLGVNDTKLKVQGRPSSDLSVIEGLGEYDIPGGLTEIPITVTAESGDERVYKIKVSRPVSNEDRARNITITGLVSEVCASYPGYCELDKEFDSDIHEYYMTVPSGIRELEFTVDKMHDYETVIGEGVSKLKEEENVVTIEITAEDGEHRKTYTYYITRDMTDDNYLSELIAKPINEDNEIGEEIDIGFHHLIEEYSFKVNNDVHSLDLSIVTDDPRATYEVVGNENFEVGENIVDIEVKANNNEIRTYRLNVYRVSNDNPLLSNIEVKDSDENSYQLSPEFSDVGKKYTVTVENEIEEVNIIATPQKDTTTVTGAGEKTLQVGRNTYTITSMAENGLTFTYEVVVIRLQNSNNYLSELSVTEGSISPEFNKEENNYELTVDAHIKSLTIEAIPEASTSTVTILNNNNFIIGENEVIIRVKAEDGTTRDYKITVTKLGSDNNYLSSLSVVSNETELLTNFDKDTGSYEINVGNEVETVEVSGEKEDSLSSVEGLRTYNLVSGNNEIKVKVTSETGIERIYTINIIRDKNSDASLSAINLSSGSINLESGVYEYTIEVEKEVERITIEGIPRVSTTEVSGNGTFELISGEEKTITLTTLAEDEESTLTYTLKITRKKNDNAYLRTLSIEEGNIKEAFDKTVNNYTLKVRNNIESVTVNAEAEEETSSVVINNPETLSVGENEVRITVTSESGNVNIYKVIVTRLTIDASKLNLSTLDVRGCTLSPEFNGDTYEYACEVGYELSDTDITATASQEEYHVSGTGAVSLEVGENVFVVTVEDEKKTESNEYTIRITRLESNETRLRNIKVMNHILNEVYDKDNSEYTLNTSENYLFITTEKMHEGEEVTIIGNNGLIVGENVVTIHVVAANKVDSRDYIIRVNKSANTNNYLQDLRVEGQTISPEFTKGRMEYALEVENEVESIIVKAAAEEETSVVSGIGMHSLVKGSNTIKVTVTAESGDERVYTIEVTKLGSRNANLSSLSVTDQTISPEFNKETTSYDLVVPYEVESVEINAVPEDSNALITGDGEVTLKQGINDKGIIVTSENGETKTYWIHITRSDPVTSKLKNIKVKNYKLSPLFESNTTNYTLIVDNEVESLDLTIEKLDPQGTYVIEGNNLAVGENTVKVISTSSDGEETTEYILTVVRQAYANTYLSSLTVSDGELTPTFDKTVLIYEVEVGYEVNQIDIEGVAENSEAIVTGNGIKNLNVGSNEYEIRVSLNGITRIYYVTIIRKGSSDVGILSITSNLGTVTKVEDTIYSLTVPYNTTEILSSNITVVPENNKAVVSKQGRLDLSVSQTYKIKVTSEDGENQMDYVINIILDKSTNNYLSSLTPSVGTLNPSFTKTREDYTIEVLDTTTEIEFTAVLEDSRAEILNDSLVFELPNYSNTIEIQVKSEKGAIRTYNITVTKSLTRERTLNDIELTGIEEIETDYEFEETTYLYSLTVPYEITNVGFNVTKKHPSQIVEIIENSNVVNSCSLVVGTNICEVKVTNSYEEELTYTYSIERLKNTNNYLRSLKLTSPNIELEDFDRERQEYNVTVPQNYENIEIEALAEDTENARVSISGTTYLIEGMDNDVSIKVRAQNGSVREYIIHVLRLPESNNLLKTLTVSSGEIYTLSPKFTPGTTEYTLEVPSPVELVGIQGLALDDNARVEGNGDYNLRIGLNKIELKVISSDLQERIYKINITRLADKNVYLSKLEVNNGSISPEFEKTKGVYRVDLPYTESSLSLNLATEDPNATYEILGNSNLKYGENEVRIKVTSSDGSASKTYVLTVVKQGNINNNLKTLKIDGETVEGFDPNITSYTYEVEYAKDNVLIEATPEDSASTVVGEGYKSLVEGTNTINVDVVSQSGLVKTYQVTVTRKLNTNLMAIVTDRGEVSPEFDKETLNYSIEVENNIKDITVIGVKESSNAEVTGNGKYELNVGENEINLEVTNGIYSRTYKLIVIRKGSSNTNLKYLTVAESILDKEYSNSENEYTLYISDDITSLSLSYEPEDETTIVEEIGNENFDEENEEVKLKITSTDKSERIVTIHVIRESESTFSNKLLNLSVNKGTMSPRYTEEVQEYTVTVPSNTKEITISATKRGEQKVEGIGTKAITKQREEFKVSVTSKDGKVRVYTLIVYKQAGTDARLSELEFNEGYLTPGFNKNVYNYVLTAESDTRIVTTKSIKTVDENASYEIYGTLLSENNKQIRIEVTAQDGETKKNYIIDVVQEKSNNANLASLTSNIGILTPTFNKNTQSYTIEVENEVSDIIIDAVPENSKATVTGDGKHNLRTGSNTINILVTAETGTVRTYTIIVNRALSSNVDLKDLYVRGYTMSPTFDKDEISYTLEVENEVTYVDIDGELADSLSSVIGLGRRDLTVGLNACDVIVTAENGNIKTYTINITRKDKLSSKIENLVVKEGTLSPTFGKEQLEYTISIPNEYRKITPIITLEDPNATYRILGNSNFVVGNNVVTIEVTSSDNKETTTYTLNVIRNISSNNYLSTLKVSEGTLTPEFDKTVGYYEVEVENDIDRITVTGTPEATTTFIAGFGSYDLEVGENMILIRTMSENGIPRSYQIKVTRKANDSNYLSDLRVLEGSLNPVFDKEHGAYEVVVEEGTKEVHIEGELESESATVTGLGTHTIKAGNNTIDVVVTSESGVLRTYTLIVVRPLSSNTNVTTFTPDTGELSPTFTNDNDDYVLNVGKNINVVNIEVVPESSEAKVGGNKNITISGNSKEATISVLAEDGTLREIKVTINRESSIEDITVNNKNILIVKGEEVELDITTTPIGANPTYTYEIENNIIDIEGKTIKGLVEGTTKVTVKVEENPLLSQDINVTVTSDKINSSIYEVKDKEERIVIGAEEGTTIEEFKDNLLNDKRVINIYDKEGNVVADTDIVRTGLTIKLENNSVTYDEAILIVRGDIDGDGIIDVTDESILTDHVLESKLITGNGIYAADIEEDGIIDVTDDSTLTDYILKIIDSLN